MLNMLAQTRLTDTDRWEMPLHLQQLAIAADAAANAFRELDEAARKFAGFPAEMRMPVEGAAYQAYTLWQEIERKGGAMLNDWRMRQAAKDAEDGGTCVVCGGSTIYED